MPYKNSERSEWTSEMKDGETACDGSNIGRLDLPLRPAIIRAKKLLLKHDRI